MDFSVTSGPLGGHSSKDEPQAQTSRAAPASMKSVPKRVAALSLTQLLVGDPTPPRLVRLHCRRSRFECSKKEERICYADAE